MYEVVLLDRNASSQTVHHSKYPTVSPNKLYIIDLMAHYTWWEWINSWCWKKCFSH